MEISFGEIVKTGKENSIHSPCMCALEVGYKCKTSGATREPRWNVMRIVYG